MKLTGAWGTAINQTQGTLFQLRALDWGVNSPLTDVPQVTVYHPDNGLLLKLFYFVSIVYEYFSRSHKYYLCENDGGFFFPFLFLVCVFYILSGCKNDAVLGV